MEDELDLRKYIDVLIRRWKLIVSITGAAVIIATLVSFLSPPVYKATASVLMTRARSEFILVPQYLTATEQDSGPMREALLAMVKSPSLANQVSKKLEGTLEPGERGIERLLSTIDVSNKGDLITISAKSRDPQKAAAIANAWTECYKNYISNIYSGVAEWPEGLMAQLDTAEKDYQEKQEAVEAFIKDNRVAELSRQINDKEILYDARLLREHIKSGSSSATSSTANSLALVLLQTRAFASLPSGLQVTLAPISSSDANLSAVDALITTLEARSGGKHGQPLAELQQDIRTLKAELEQEQAKQRKIERARDIAWEAYITIIKKSVETKLAPQAQAGVVEVAEFAAVPISPTTSRKAVNIGIALVLGAIVGILSAFGLEYFSKPRKRPARPKTKS